MAVNAGPRDLVEQKIRELLVDELGVDPQTAATSDPGTPLLGRGIGLDSLEAMVLVTGLEEAFDITVDDADLSEELVRSIDTLVDYVIARGGAHQ